MSENRIEGVHDDLHYVITGQATEHSYDFMTRVVTTFIEEYDSHNAEKDLGDWDAAQKFYAAVFGAVARHYQGEDPAPQEGTHRIADVVREMLDELEANGHL